MKIYHRDASTGKTTVTSYGHSSSGTSKGLSDFKAATSTESKSTTQSDAALEAEKEKLLKQARFNANVKSLMNAGFTQREAENLAAQYFDDTTVSIGKILSNAPQNSTVKLSDGRVTTVGNAAKLASSTVASTTPTSTKKLEASIDKLAAEYAAKGVPKERFFQKVARDIRTEDMAVQRYLMKYSKTAAGVFGEMREQSARLADIADTFSMLPAGVKYAINNPSTIPSSLKQGVTGTATGIKADFSSNPSRATVSLLVSIVLTTKIVKGTSRVAAKVPSTKTVINKISTVNVKGRVTSSVAKEIKVVERTTYSRLNSLANDYAKTLRKYDNTFTNVHVIKKGTPRYNKAIQEMKSIKTELKTIENKIRNVVDEKIEFEKAVNKLAGKSDSSLTYAGIQKAIGKMSPSEYKQFMQNVKAGKSVAEFGLTEKALQNVASIQKDFKITPKKVTEYQFERAYKPVEPSGRTYADPVSKVSKLEGELSMYCKLERSPVVKRARVTTKVKSRQTVEEAMGIKFKLPEMKIEVEKAVKTSTKLRTKVRAALKTATKTKTKASVLALTKARAEVKTNIQTLTKTQTKLQTAVRTMTKTQTKTGTKTATKVSPATLTAVKTQLATVTKALAVQKTLLRTITTTISKIPEVPVTLPRAKLKDSRSRVPKKRTTRGYTPKQITNRVATFKQMFG